MADTSINEDVSAVDASSIIVFHPGSKYLRFGRASDSNPRKILHCVARKRSKNPRAKSHRDSPCFPDVVDDDDKLAVVDNCRQKVAASLQKSIRSDGRKRIAALPKKLAELNASQSPRKILADSNGSTKCVKNEWHETKDEYVVGDEVARLHPDTDYNVHFPFRRGDVHVHGGLGGSPTSAFADLQTIWGHVVEHMVGVRSRADLANYKAVVVIPALFDRPMVKQYLTLVLTSMGFGSAFVLQDHVAAAFGAGLGSACVVDVGDQKTSISCVEDGISHADTRIHLNYGGADITKVFFYLLRQIEFPYKGCEPNTNHQDFSVVEKLKVENCHLDLDICGTAEKHFDVASLGSTEGLRYSVFLSDECLIAPMAFFDTELLELCRDEKWPRVRFMSPYQADSEDPHDQTYLNETSRKYTKAGDTSVVLGENMGEVVENGPQLDDELDILSEDAITANVDRRPSVTSKVSKFEAGELMALDQAILKSIELCPSEDSKKKMFSCVLLVGGGLNFRHADKFLTQKLALQIPQQYRLDPLEVITNAKGSSADETTWRGAAILSCLDSAQDLWIQTKEWQKQGQRLLREKAPFPWA